MADDAKGGDRPSAPSNQVTTAGAVMASESQTPQLVTWLRDPPIIYFFYLSLQRQSKAPPCFTLPTRYSAINHVFLCGLRISDTSHHCDNRPDKGQLKEGRACLGSRFEGTQSSLMEDDLPTDCVVSGHSISAARKQKGMTIGAHLTFSAFLFIQSGSIQWDGSEYSR